MTAAAITGLGVVSPIGVGIGPFTRALRDGVSGTRALGFTHPKMRSTVAATCDGFDPRTVLPAADVKRLPRLIPLALAAASEAVRASGLSAWMAASEPPPAPADASDALDRSRRIAVVLGTGGGGIDFTLDQAAALRAGEASSLWAMTNATHGNLAGELSIRLGCRGPSLCISDGCASSSNAVAAALSMLRSDRPGAPDAVVVVGADAHIRAEVLIGMEQLRVISTADHAQRPEAASRPFDRDRDGFVLGEGAWAVVLERPDAARARGVRPVAWVCGAGQTCDAYHRVRPDPDMTEGVRAMRLAIEDAGLEPEDIDLVHYHGTGTRVNDVQETRAARATFGAHAERLGGHSIKGAIGHPQGASGLASLVGTVACLAAEEPFSLPTLNLDHADPECDLDYTPLVARPTAARRVLVNCLAFGAKNTALVVSMDEPP